MSVICLIDNTEHADLAALHKYLRPRMKQEAYYRHYLNKKDPVTGADIPFKNVDQYLSQDFIDKESLKKWIKLNPVAGREWAVKWLKTRKEEKGLTYAPSQVELRSLECPSMHYYDSVGGYYAIARELGYVDRYLPRAPFFVPLLAACSVIQDSREQQPIKLPLKTVVGKVDEGDYALAAPHDRGIYIERKSLGDLVGTFNRRVNQRVKKDSSVTLDTSFDRFDRELGRAAEKNSYIVMVVESSLDVALNYDDEQSDYYDPSMRWSKAGPQHVMKNLRDLLTKYPLTFQAVFADGRAEAARVMMRIFEAGEDVKRVDLQYNYERRLL